MADIVPYRIVPVKSAMRKRELCGLLTVNGLMICERLRKSRNVSGESDLPTPKRRSAKPAQALPHVVDEQRDEAQRQPERESKRKAKYVSADCVRPRFHDGAPLLQQIASRIGGDSRGALDVRKRELRQQFGHVRFPCLLLKAGPQTVRRHAHPRALEQVTQAVVTEHAMLAGEAAFGLGVELSRLSQHVNGLWTQSRIGSGNLIAICVRSNRYCAARMPRTRTANLSCISCRTRAS